MRKISVWANRNKIKARIALSFCFIMLYATGLYCGHLFKTAGITISFLLLIPAGILYLGMQLYFPTDAEKKSLGMRRYFNRSRISHFFLSLSLFMLLLFLGNRPEYLFKQSLLATKASASSLLPGDSTQHYWNPVVFRSMMKDANGKKLKLKERKKLLRQQISAIQHSKSTDGEKALLIALAIIVALGLMYLVAALSCAIICSDAAFLGILTLGVGAFLIVFGLIKVIRSITKGKPKEDE